MLFVCFVPFVVWFLAMTHTITLIPGDGIGPEVTEAVVRILKASGVAIEWDEHLAGLLAFERSGQSLPIALTNFSASRTSFVKMDDVNPWGTPFWIAIASSKSRYVSK